MFGATLLSPIAPASADQVTNLHAQAAQLSQEMLLEQLQIGGYLQQRNADTAGVAADNAQLAAMQAQMAATHRRISLDMANLRNAAVKAYVEGGAQADGTGALFASDPSNGASAVYDQVVTGDLSTAIDNLRIDRRALGREEAAQQEIAAQAQQRLAQANAELAAAQATEQKLAQQHATISGQLAAAIAQQQAQAAAAAAAAQALRSAAPAPPARAATAPPSAPTPAPSAATGALPALNPFLSCVIQAESGGNYQAISPTGLYMGAFQFSQSTWNDAAQLAGLPTLVGVPPYKASPRDQCLLAIALYNADGEQPWYDPCRS